MFISFTVPAASLSAAWNRDFFPDGWKKMETTGVVSLEVSGLPCF
jgi:hypothetical protein